eukprot:c15288_g1_i1.p1 GENE.c15288_g1_i1~~c15288_g1_i1.p1  ORF type:complete len:237 (+),score=84.77 c15288_g1_i1:71-712(+)
MFKRHHHNQNPSPQPQPSVSIPETRIAKEITDLKDSTLCGVSAAPINANDTTKWKGIIEGPSGTPYEGGKFVVNITLPEQYPFAPPKMKFETRLWHPNVSSQTGAICLDILKDQWSPALTIRTALQSLQALLSAPVPDDPQDAVVAKMYMENKALFDKTAKQWTEQHAIEKPLDPEQVSNLVEMGFSKAAVEDALRQTKNDQQAALELLLAST